MTVIRWPVSTVRLSMFPLYGVLRIRRLREGFSMSYAREGDGLDPWKTSVFGASIVGGAFSSTGRRLPGRPRGLGPWKRTHFSWIRGYMYSPGRYLV